VCSLKKPTTDGGDKEEPRPIVLAGADETGDQAADEQEEREDSTEQRLAGETLSTSSFFFGLF